MTKISASSNSSKISLALTGKEGLLLTIITFPHVRKVTTAIASYLETAYTKDRPVLIAYDTRFLADQFARTTAQVFAD